MDGITEKTDIRRNRFGGRNQNFSLEHSEFELPITRLDGIVK